MGKATTGVEQAAAGDVLTIGVEEELLLVDRESGLPAPDAAEVVAAIDAGTSGEVTLELTRPQLETNSAVCSSLTELREHLLVLRHAAVRAAQERGHDLVATGVAVIGELEQPMTPDQRYRRIASAYGLLAREQSVCGAHVHVAVPDRASGVEVLNHLRPWLPTLLALTANSPVANSRDTDYASWRWVTWARWPSAGPPPYFPDAGAYDAMVDMLLESGAAADRRMLYWDARVSEKFPTIEVRVSDCAATVDEAVLLAGLVRGLTATALRAVEAGEPAPAIDAPVLRVAMWRAAKDGLTGDSFDVVRRVALPAREQLQRLVSHAASGLRETGDADTVSDLLARLLQRGNGAARQRAAWARREDPHDVLALLVAQTAGDGSFG
ncbi:MAG: glutamate--cysteine ligase [Actinomycetota bacterium]|jgi:carboxylate-amine ligase|nr:glutamate--cysteine ligase [Actinomycetota bacterium]